MLSFQIVLSAPYMTYEQYAEVSGLSKRTISDWARDGILPIMPKTGVRQTPVINMVALLEKASREAHERLG